MSLLLLLNEPAGLANAALAATESADTAAVSVVVQVSGALAATDTADITAAGAYFAPPYFAPGYFAPHYWHQYSTQWQVQVWISGSTAATEATDSVALSGSVLVSGTLASTEAMDSVAFATSAVGAATLTAIETSDSASASGQILTSAALAATDPSDQAALGATVEVGATLATSDATDVAAFAGQVISSGEITADLAAVENADIASFIVTAATEQASGLGGSGGGGVYRPRPDAPRRVVNFARLDATESPDVCRMTATVDWSGDDEEFLLLSEAA